MPQSGTRYDLRISRRGPVRSNREISLVESAAPRNQRTPYLDR